MNHSSSWEVSTQTFPRRGKTLLVEFSLSFAKGEKVLHPQKTDIEPENGPLGKGASFSKLSFSGSMLIFRGVLGGGFKYFLFSPLFGEDSQFD